MSVADSDAVIANPLRASGLIDPAGLDRARKWQAEKGGLLSDALLSLGLVKESDFLRVFAELYSTRFVKADKLKGLKLDQSLLEKVGVRVVEKLRACPVRWDSGGGELHVVAAVPLSTDVEPELRRLTHARSVSVYVATAAAVHALIRRTYYSDVDAFDAVNANGAGPHQFKETEQWPALQGSDSEVTRSGVEKTQVSNVSFDETLTIATLRKENARYRIAQEFHRRVSLERTLEAMVDRIMTVVFDLFQSAEGAAISLVDGRFATKSKDKAKTVDVPRTVIEQALVSPNGVLVNNALIDERFDKSQSVMIRGVQSVMAVPLRARNRTLGVLYVDSVSMSAAFSEEDLPLLDSVGAQAAILLDNASLVATVKQEVEKRASLSRFLSPAAVEEVLSGRTSLKLEGAAAEVTVMFADIRGFTTMSAQMPPDQVVGILNRFFEEMVDAVEVNHGTVDKFIGDCVMALWGAPVERPDDARNALLAALAMVQRSSKIQVNGAPLEMGIGITTGPAVVGAIGSRKRLDYTAIGSTVNLAARLCGIARSGEVLVTSDTLMHAGEGVIVEANEPVILKGLDQPIVPYTLRNVAAKRGDPKTLMETQPVPKMPTPSSPRRK
ncbi:MAG: adenylate/guanylate cyclase domain-containing protein [Myxococcaceae bacterium]